MKTKYANHPLFKMLLEDAELEYGYSSEGPILLPCDVDLFYKVLAEMDSKDDLEIHPGCGFAYGPCSPFNSSRRLANSGMAKGYGAYGLLTPSRLSEWEWEHIQGGSGCGDVELVMDGVGVVENGRWVDVWLGCS
ncbi:hypothetical protein F0562_023237 [Nyssa sinensis]|uniref:Auxin-responsive protein n=1 Tax=Nyssa sinensis TaxID=561372 RepID=A0A5J5BG67_9ASTE|nr:hypothetical protein F0562_023237 [Nyssa sinensis]